MTRRRKITERVETVSRQAGGARLLDLRSLGWIKWDGRAWVRAEAFPPPAWTAPTPAPKSGPAR